jgi:hypothetical protein
MIINFAVITVKRDVGFVNFLCDGTTQENDFSKINGNQMIP